MRLEEVVAMPCESARFGGERGEVGGRGAKLKGGGGVIIGTECWEHRARRQGRG